MPTTGGHNPPPSNSLHLSSSGHGVPDTPVIPSPKEAKFYYYGIYSRPCLIARSSTDPWIEPCGPEAYLTPKALSSLGFNHRLREIWESMVGPAIISYLDTKGVQYTSLDPVRIGHNDDPSPPAIIWIGVHPNSLSAENGVEIAIQCKNILCAHGINDIHVELRESEMFRSAKLYEPVPTSIATVRVIEPFSTAVGVPISTEATASIGGTGGFFVSDRSHPGKIFLMTARHVVIHDNNEPYEYIGRGQPHRKVLLFSNPGAEKYLTAIKTEIDQKRMTVNYLEKRLEVAEQLRVEYAEVERNRVELQLNDERESIEVLEKFLLDATSDWKDQKNRVIGHIFLSPPISLDVGEDGFTEDWAIIEIDHSRIDRTNFIGNAVDLGIDVPVYDFTSWMYPRISNPHAFEYPVDRLHKIFGTILDSEMWNPDPKTRDHKDDPVIMVMKRGHGSGLTVGRLNTIRSFVRSYLKGKLIGMSKEVAVLPRDSKSGPFSKGGDSGSCVVDGRGRIAGLLTGGAGSTDALDCTYVTSANFIWKCMVKRGLRPNFFPAFDD